MKNKTHESKEWTRHCREGLADARKLKEDILNSFEDLIFVLKEIVPGEVASLDAYIIPQFNSLMGETHEFKLYDMMEAFDEAEREIIGAEIAHSKIKDNQLENQ